MKLKKIVSLALAGILAVSMLTACDGGDKGGSSSSEPTAPATGIVAAANDAQSAYNKVKVSFAADASLDTALAKAVKSEGDNAIAASVMGVVAKLTGIKYDANMNATIQPDSVDRTGALVNANVDGKVVTDLNGFVVENALSEDAAMKIAAKKINDDAVANLVDTTYEEGKIVSGKKYADYSYTGTVSMVSVQNVDGTTDYYVAYTITKTTDVVTFKKG